MFNLNNAQIPRLSPSLFNSHLKENTHPFFENNAIFMKCPIEEEYSTIEQEAVPQTTHDPIVKRTSSNDLELLTSLQIQTNNPDTRMPGLELHLQNSREKLNRVLEERQGIQKELTQTAQLAKDLETQNRHLGSDLILSQQQTRQIQLELGQTKEELNALKDTVKGHTNELAVAKKTKEDLMRTLNDLKETRKLHNLPEQEVSAKYKGVLEQCIALEKWVIRVTHHGALKDLLLAKGEELLKQLHTHEWQLARCARPGKSPGESDSALFSGGDLLMYMQCQAALLEEIISSPHGIEDLNLSI